MVMMYEKPASMIKNYTDIARPRVCGVFEVIKADALSGNDTIIQ